MIAIALYNCVCACCPIVTKEKGSVNENNTLLGVGVEGALAAVSRQRLHSGCLIGSAIALNVCPVPGGDDLPVVPEKLRQLISYCGYGDIASQFPASTLAERVVGVSSRLERFARFSEPVSRLVHDFVHCFQCTMVVLPFDIPQEFTLGPIREDGQDFRLQFVERSIKRFTVILHYDLSWLSGFGRVKIAALCHKSIYFSI